MAINIDSIVESILQRPLVSGMPLYVRVDGGVDMNGATNKNVDSGWVKESQARCTSPDNVKRVFISCTGVKKHLFLPIGKEGQLELGASYDDTLINDLNERKALISQGLSASEILQARESNEKNKQVRKYEQINGYGFGALQKAHVYQNVEEVYIDKILFMGMSNKTGFDFNQYLKQYKPDEALKEAFIRENASNISEVTSRFKRLNTLT